jgi:hypothetical protein
MLSPPVIAIRAISGICKSQPLTIELVHTYRLTRNLEYTINHTPDSCLPACERKGSAVCMLNYDVMYEINGKICVTEIMFALN